MNGARAAEATYADIAPILEQRCIVCHSGPAAPRGLRLDSLAGVNSGGDRGPVVKSGDPANSELIRRLKGSSLPRMPMTGPPYLAEAEVDLIADWIAAGMPEGARMADEPGAATDEENIMGRADPAATFVTFDAVAPIFATRCAKCHTDNGLMGGPPEGYRLTAYESVIAASDRIRIVPGNAAASELVRRVRGHSRPRMPFDGPPYLSEAEIALIEQWVADGARDTAGDMAPLPVGARIRLQGRLTAHWQLDDLVLNITSKTRVDKNPRVGDSVRVRGRLLADGSLQIERIQRD